MMEMEEEEEEYGNYSNYYVVQSPSSVSHANSNTTTSHSDLCRNPQPYPLQQEQDQPLVNQHNPARISTFSSLSRCSSSRASTTSLVQQNNIRMTVLPAASHYHANVILDNNNNKNMIVPATTGLTKMVKVDYDNHQGKCWQYFSLNTFTSPFWISLQLLWRFLLSAMLALLVFYLVTKPQPPHISVKVIGVNQFELTEGVDLTGVATTLLSCNISTTLVIDNKSKVFGLHILPPVVDIYFGRLPFVTSQGPKMYVESREWREMSVYTGTTKKAMYGGGSNMKDMLISPTGLPLFITLSFNSYFRVLSNFIHSHFHHQARCLLLLHNSYDLIHRTLSQSYNTTCHLLTS